MKRSMFVLAIVLAAFVTGCRDNSVTNPSDNSSVALHSGSGALQKKESITIPINAILRDPSQAFNSFLEVKGEAVCELTIVPILSRDVVEVATLVNVRVTPFGMNKPAWSVNSGSTNRLDITRQGVGTVERAYPVVGRSDGLMLNIRFRVRLTTVEIEEVWLTLFSPAVAEDVAN